MTNLAYIKHIIANIAHVPVSKDSEDIAMYDLGLDSLCCVELQMAIEHAFPDMLQEDIKLKDTPKTIHDKLFA
jgi:acyl carrier protein